MAGNAVATGSTRPRQRLPRAERRAQLLELAEELFLTEGYTAISMDTLAERSGVTKPVVYDHFGSKDGLIEAIIERHAQALADAVDVAVAQAATVEERFWNGSRAFFAWAGERGPGLAVVLGPGRLPESLSERVHGVRQAQVDQTLRVLTASLTEGSGLTRKEQKRIVAGLRPIAELLTGAYEALALWWQRDAPHLSVDQVTDQFRSLMWPGLELTIATLVLTP